MRAAGIDLSMAVIQTAYANGASTIYLHAHNITAGCAKTGVKHLHHEALHYDVGVYFEANGHGTVLFSQAAIDKFNSASPTSEAASRALEVLRSLVDLINQTVGGKRSTLAHA